VFRKLLLAGWALGLLLWPMVASAKTSSVVVTISVAVDTFAEWADPAPVVFETDWSGHVSRMKQPQTVSKMLVLYANVDTLLTAAGGTNGGVLTRAGQQLQTAYQVTGDVAAPDVTYKPAAQFFGSGNSYRVTYVPGTGAYAVNLNVRAMAPADRAPESGTYTCSVVMTATW